MFDLLPDVLPFSLPVCLAFWFAVWAGPLRAWAGASAITALAVGEPRWPVLRRLGPLLVQRWVAESVISHVAWRAQQARPPRYYCDALSEPCWASAMTMGCEARHEMDEHGLCWYATIEVERIVRILEAPSGEVSARVWLRALVGSCWRIALVYEELRKRHGMMWARTMMRGIVLTFRREVALCR